MPNIGNAVVLGGTSPHIALIGKLKARGYVVYLVDYYENPPARSYCDHHIKLSTLDKVAVLDFAKKIDAKIVISTNVDQANLVACYVSEQLNLPHPYSSVIAEQLTDKTLMKSMMLSAGIPTANFVILDDNIRDANNLFVSSKSRSLVVKPADSTGSAGVRKVSDEAELISAVSHAKDISRNGKVIVEEFIEGFEISADFFVEESQSTLLTVRKKFRFAEHDNDWVIQSPGSFAPAGLSNEAYSKLKDIAASIAKSFRLYRTPLLVQALVQNNDINVIEFAPRIGGGLSYRTVQLVTGFDLLEGAVRSYTGEQTQVTVNPSPRFYTTLIIYGTPSTFSHVDGIDSLQAEDIVDEFYLYRTSGSLVSGDMSTRSRIGAMILSGRDSEDLKLKITQVKNRLSVYSDSGEDILRREFIDDVIRQFDDGFVSFNMN